MHHVMAFASLYIGDSQTMAAEAGVLGVPFVRFNDFVGRIGSLRELEDVYRLGFGVHASPLERDENYKENTFGENNNYINQKNTEKNEGLSDTGSISTETAPQSACMQASRQTDDPFRSIDSVAQTLSNNPSQKTPKNISFTNAPQAKNDKNVIYRLDGTVQPSGVEALIETVEALVGDKGERLAVRGDREHFDALRAEFQKRRERMLGEKIDCAKFLTYFIEHYPESVAETKAAAPEFWKKFM